MANRLIRNTAILLKTETTYNDGTTTPAGASDALLVSNLSINPLNAQNVDRDIIRPYLGGSEQLLGTRYVELGFDLELAGSGTVATAPPWAAALLSCGFAQTLTSTIRADYTPISTAFPSATIYWYDDGVLHVARGCRGTAQVNMRVGERPVVSMRFTGIYTTPTAASNPSVTLTAWKTPQVVTDANTQDTTFGGTHNASVAPAITGGTISPSQGIEIDVGNSVNFTPLLGGETVDITQRTVTGPSVYTRMGWEQNNRRVVEDRAPIDWIVLRNRLTHIDSRNKRDIGTLLEKLAHRIGFRVTPGLGERMVYRELFLSGVTVFDLTAGGDSVGSSAAARGGWVGSPPRALG